MRSSEFYPATLHSPNRYIVIDDLDICVVITRSDEGEVGFKWEIRWRWGNEPTGSKWIYVGEQTAINEA
jgi:hypothetical protein